MLEVERKFVQCKSTSFVNGGGGGGCGDRRTIGNLNPSRFLSKQSSHSDDIHIRRRSAVIEYTKKITDIQRLSNIDIEKVGLEFGIEKILLKYESDNPNRNRGFRCLPPNALRKKLYEWLRTVQDKRYYIDFLFNIVGTHYFVAPIEPNQLYKSFNQDFMLGFSLTNSAKVARLDWCVIGKGEDQNDNNRVSNTAHTTIEKGYWSVNTHLVEMSEQSEHLGDAMVDILTLQKNLEQ